MTDNSIKLNKIITLETFNENPDAINIYLKYSALLKILIYSRLDIILKWALRW